MNNKTEKKNRKGGAKKMSIAKIKKDTNKELLLKDKIELKKKIDTKINENSLKLKKELDTLKNKTSKKKDKKSDKANEEEIKKDLKKEYENKKKILEEEGIEGEDKLEAEVEEKLFCESLSECSSRLLRIIGYYSLTDTLKNQINSSILNLSYLLKVSFNESIKFCVTILGVLSFSVPKLENVYNYTKNKSNEFYNSLPSVSEMASNLSSKLLTKISSIENLSPKEIFERIKTLIMNNKMLISISTVLLVIISLKVCSFVSRSNNKENYKLNESFSDILTKYLNFFPFTTQIGKIIIEYTGLFMDTAHDIVNKIISKIVSICSYVTRNNVISNNNTLENNKATNIALQHYQKNTVDYLTNKCINQHGLLIYHNMGTGKTLTGLSIILKNITYKNININDVIIICPDMIKISWIKESSKLNLKFSTNTFMNYEKFHNFIINAILNDKNSNNIDILKNKFLILDEGHHLIPYLKRDNNNYYYNYIEILSKTKNVLILTGTPFYYSKFSAIDICYLLNICEGTKNSFPIIDDLFQQKYINKKKIDDRKNTLLFNIIKPSLYYLYSGSFTIVKVILGSFFKDWSMKAYFINPLYTSNIFDKLFEPLNIIFRNIYFYVIAGKMFLNNFKSNNHQEKKRQEEDIKSSEDQSNKGLNNYAKEYFPTASNRSISPAIGTFFFAYIAQLMNSKFYLFDNTNGCIEKAKARLKFDDKKLGADVSQYVSYFKNEKKDPNMAQIILSKYIETRYSYFQSDLCFKIYLGIIESNYIEFITGFTKNEMNLKGDILKTLEGTLTYSICIGNFSSYVKTIIDKNYQFKVDHKIGTITMPELNIDIIKNETCYKFIEIKNYIKNNKHKRLIISSMFAKQGAYLLSMYLNAYNIPHLYLNSQLTIEQKIKIVDMYNDNRFNIILIDKSASEGISLQRVNEMHLLEPVSNLSLRDQVISRAVRYESHKGIVDAKVYVFTYVSVLIINSIDLKSDIELMLNQADDAAMFKVYEQQISDIVSKNLQGIIPTTGIGYFDSWINPIKFISSTGANRFISNNRSETLVNRVTPDNLAVVTIMDQESSLSYFNKILVNNNILDPLFNIPDDCISREN